MSDATSTSTNISTTEKPREEGIKTVKANSMNFTDAQGQQHWIHIPAERFDEAIKYFVDENWDELKKFDKWEDQKYQDHEISVEK